jgi:hypothetical protein
MVEIGFHCIESQRASYPEQRQHEAETQRTPRPKARGPGGQSAGFQMMAKVSSLSWPAARPRLA